MLALSCWQCSSRMCSGSWGVFLVMSDSVGSVPVGCVRGVWRLFLVVSFCCCCWWYFINPLRKILIVFLDKVTATARAALPIPTSVCSIHLCPNGVMAASVEGFLSCAQMLMQAVVHGAVRTQ